MTATESGCGRELGVWVDAGGAAGSVGAGCVCGPRVQRDGEVPGARVSGQHRRVDAAG